MGDISPEAFLDELGMSEADVALFRNYAIFSVRQLATADLRDILEVDTGRLAMLIERAKSIVTKGKRRHSGGSGPAAEQQSKKRAEKVWACSYISPLTEAQILADSSYKSAYLLFQDYLERSPDSRELHPWKMVFANTFEEAKKWKNDVDRPISDIDIFSHLTWRTALSLGKYDLTAGVRAIPFLFSWLPGEFHGNAIAMDKVNATETQNPLIADRFVCPISIDLTLLCEAYGAKLFATDGKLETPWKEISLDEVRQESVDYSSFCAGQNIFEHTPHGCIVTPTGEIPLECIKIYPKKEPIIQEIHF